MTDHTTEETGWVTLAAHMVTAEPRRSLWSPETEPMTWKGYLASAALSVAAIIAFVLWSAVLP